MTFSHLSMIPSQELAPLYSTEYRLLGFIGPVPPPLLIRSRLYSVKEIIIDDILLYLCTKVNLLYNKIYKILYLISYRKGEFKKSLNL